MPGHGEHRHPFSSLCLSAQVIASNYSPQAQALTIDHDAHVTLDSTMIRRKPPMKKKDGNDTVAVDVRNVDWTSEWPSIVEDSPIVAELDSVALSKGEFCRILSRYKHYTEGGVPSDVLAPYHRQWLEHAVLLLELQNPARWPSLSEDQQEQLIEELRHEILKGYIRAAKTSVVNYALLDDRCRHRLDIPFVPLLPPEWGRLTYTVPDIGTPGGPPEHWRAGLQAARTSLAMRHVQNSTTALRLVDFWLENCQDC